MARPRLVSDEEIFEATRAALVEEGPAVSVQSIAARLGVSAAAVLKRLGSRDALMARALCFGTPLPFVEVLSRPPALAPLRSQLHEILVGVLGFFVTIAPLLGVARAGRIDLSEARPGVEPVPLQLRRLLTRYLQDARAMGLAAPAHPQGAAWLLLGAIEARGFHVWLDDRVESGSDDAFVDRLLDGVWPPAVD